MDKKNNFCVKCSFECKIRFALEKKTKMYIAATLKLPHKCLKKTLIKQFHFSEIVRLAFVIYNFLIYDDTTTREKSF